MTTIDNIMALHNAASHAAVQYALLAQVSLRSERSMQALEDRNEANEALRTALTEALAQPIQTPGCTSNCDNCTYSHGSPAHAGHCYMFYDEPQGVCAQWKDANPTIQKYPEKDISAKPVRGPLSDEQCEALIVILQNKRVSISQVQRYLKISYNNANVICRQLISMGFTHGFDIAPQLLDHSIGGDK